MKNINEPIYETADGDRYQERSAFGRGMHVLGGVAKGVIRGSALGMVGWVVAAALTTTMLGLPAFLATVGIMAAVGAGIYAQKALNETPGHHHHAPDIKKPASKPVDEYQPYNHDIIRNRERDRHALPEHRHRRNDFAARERNRRAASSEGRHHRQ